MTDFRRPESVLVVVFTDDANVLLLRRVRPFDFWQSVTGSLQEHESIDAAARRELLEETGLSTEGELVNCGRERVFTIDPRLRHRYASGVNENREYEWRFRLPAKQAISIDACEHSGHEWCHIDHAIERVWSWTNREALEALRDSM